MPPPSRPIVSIPRYTSDRMKPLRLVIVAFTMPLSSVQVFPLSTTVTGAVASVLATFGAAADVEKPDATNKATNAGSSNVRREQFRMEGFMGRH